MLNRASKLFAICIIVSSLVACDSDDSQLPVNLVNTGAVGSQEMTTQNSDEQQVEGIVATADRGTLDGSWLSNCFTFFPDEPTEYEREFIVIQGASYERTINYYQDSDCSVPSEISFIRIRSSDFQITNDTFQTVLGTASIFDIGVWNIDFDESTFSDDEVGLFDPAFGIYGLFLLSLDGRLFFGSQTPPFIGEQHLSESRYFIKQ